MLEAHDVAEVRRLLDRGKSHRAIRAITGRSMKTIGRISRREPVGRQPRTRTDAGVMYPDKRMPPVRCPRHGLVYPPCLACQVEAVANRSNGGYP